MLSSLEEHYSQLLCLTDDWSVTSVDLDPSGLKVSISLAFSGNHGPCSHCGEVSPFYDHRSQERSWRHLDIMQFETRLHSRIPRVNCLEHGVKSMMLPWASKRSRFTLLFELFSIRVLQASRSVEEARKLLGLSWNAVEAIKARAVERGLSRRELVTIEYLGIDEKSHRKGHDYVTLINDIDGGRVLDGVKDRTQAACEEALEVALTDNQREQVKAVAIDRWPAFINAVEVKLSDSAIVHDRFPISQHLNKAVDQVRRDEHRDLLSQGDTRLKKSRYHWLKNEENLSNKAAEHFESLKHDQLLTARAWAIKELFRDFWTYKTAGWAKRFFSAWYAWAIRCRLDSIKKVAKMIKTHMPNILTWFKHTISNAVSEGLNSKIQTVKSNARGFRSFESYRRSILFYCGKLDREPVASQ